MTFPLRDPQSQNNEFIPYTDEELDAFIGISPEGDIDFTVIATALADAINVDNDLFLLINAEVE